MKKVSKVEKEKSSKFFSKVIEEHNMNLPIEVLKNLPCIYMVGNEQIKVENYKGIIEYTEIEIKLNTKIGIVKICGKNLNLKQISSDSITIDGYIDKFEYLT